MNANEERMQNSLENGQVPSGDELDVKAYQAVFRALKKQPRYELAPEFAERVVSRVITKQRKGVSGDYLWLGAGLFVLLVAFIGTVVYTGFRFDLGFLNMMSDYKGLAVFGMVFITILNLLDKRLRRTGQFKPEG